MRSLISLFCLAGFLALTLAGCDVGSSGNASAPQTPPVVTLAAPSAPASLNEAQESLAALPVSDKTFSNDAVLEDHFSRHGADFGARNAAEYQMRASTFLTGAPGQNVLVKRRPNGDIVRFNTMTNAFGVISRRGIIRTYFKPDRGLSYFNAQ